MNFILSQQYVQITCCHQECQCSFALTKDMNDLLRKTHRRFFCPNGHGQSYNGQTAEEKKIAEIDESAFNHFVEIPCDKCKTLSSYAPDAVKDVTECFGCKCERLEKYEVHCSCGWHGKWFEDMPHDENLQNLCPKCGSKVDDKTAKAPTD